MNMKKQKTKKRIVATRSKTVAKKGRARGRRGFTEAFIRKMKIGLQKGIPQAVIAEKMDVSQPFVSAVKKGRCWAHVKV